jgi:general secretion pathway protein I
MTEVEERLLKLGYPEADTNDDGACCEDDSRPDMRCSWKIERVELPQMKPPDLAPASSSGAMNLGSSGFGSSGQGSGSSASPGGGPLAAITQLATNPGAFAGDGGVSSLASALQEGTGGVGGIESLAMTFVYPILKPMLEASIRKVTVKIAWHEGSQDRDITIVQYLTRPMRPPPLAPGAASGQSPLVPGLPGLPGLFPGLPSSGRGASP